MVINCYIFWDFEITEKPEIVKSIIDSKLGIIANKIGASRCKIIEVDTKTATQFINDNHLSGNTPAKFKYGLSYRGGELVAIATFSKARFSKEDAQELVRFCVKRNYHVHGALSKLINMPCDYIILILLVSPIDVFQMVVGI